MFRIMEVVTEKKNNNSLYKFMKTVDEKNNEVILEIDTKEELDQKVEELLNGEYAKKDFIIVEMLDYDIDAKIYEEP